MGVDILIQYPKVYFTFFIFHLLISISVLPDVIKCNSLSYYMCNCEPTLLIKGRTEQYCLRNANSNKQPAEPLKNLHKLTGKKKSKNKPAKRDIGYRFCRFCYLHKHDVGYSFSSKRKKKKHWGEC